MRGVRPCPELAACIACYWRRIRLNRIAAACCARSGDLGVVVELSVGSRSIFLFVDDNPLEPIGEGHERGADVLFHSLEMADARFHVGLAGANLALANVRRDFFCGAATGGEKGLERCGALGSEFHAQVRLLQD